MTDWVKPAFTLHDWFKGLVINDFKLPHNTYYWMIVGSFFIDGQLWVKIDYAESDTLKLAKRAEVGYDPKWHLAYQIFCSSHRVVHRE